MSCCSQGELRKILETEVHFFSHLWYFVCPFFQPLFASPVLIMILVLVRSRRSSQTVATDKDEQQQQETSVSATSCRSLAVLKTFLHLRIMFTQWYYFLIHLTLKAYWLFEYVSLYWKKAITNACRAKKNEVTQWITPIKIYRSPCNTVAAALRCEWI